MNGIEFKRINNAEQKNTNTFFVSLSDLLNKDISFSGNKLSDKQKEYLYLEMNILLGAGVDIKSALELIIAGQQKKAAKTIVMLIKEKVIAGSSVSAAMQDTGFFSAYEYFSIQIGEETGKLPLVLKELAAYYQKKIKQKRQVISALSYPVVVLITSFLAILFMVGYIVPMFADVFQHSGGKLPLITALIIKISAFISHYFYIFFLVLVIIAGVLFRFRKHSTFRHISSSILLKIPLVGSIVQKVYLARFCHSMSLLISSRVPILRALGMVHKMIQFYPIENSLVDIEEQVLKGVSLHTSFSSFPIFPAKMVMLIKVGEEVNRLDYFFTIITEQYNEEVEYQTGIISTVLEPLIIILLGLVVGVILIAMYLPLFKLGAGF